jgi:hypothetical protein
MVTWLVADSTVTIIDVLPNESHESHDQHDERRFCPKDDVCVAFSTISKRKIITVCHYLLNVGCSAVSDTLVEDVRTAVQANSDFLVPVQRLLDRVNREKGKATALLPVV